MIYYPVQKDFQSRILIYLRILLSMINGFQIAVL